ncbi:MAG: dTDP-glucose 4,6-dehydratase [Kiloniellales bacterium]
MAQQASERPLLVTGGAGFIGSCFVRRQAAAGQAVVTLDLLTYAGRRENLPDSPNQRLVVGDIRDGAMLAALFAEAQPRAVVHFAAESHVDRSLIDAAAFVSVNVEGTWRLLEAALAHWDGLKGTARDRFRFLHISTDEVFGSLGLQDPPFSEASPYDPRSPYAASKAAADHLVRAWHHSYGLPALLVNCSNNYGPHQFPEKLIPLVITNALLGRPLPVYGEGANVRDWLHVEDHCAALELVLRRGRLGETYCIGGEAERQNLAVVEAVCDLLDRLEPRLQGSHREQITFVADRPGHDLRYAIDCSKAKLELGWAGGRPFAEGLHQTVAWYRANRPWWEAIRNQVYDADRLGLRARS